MCFENYTSEKFEKTYTRNRLLFVDGECHRKCFEPNRKACLEDDAGDDPNNDATEEIDVDCIFDGIAIENKEEAREEADDENRSEDEDAESQDVTYEVEEEEADQEEGDGEGQDTTYEDTEGGCFTSIGFQPKRRTYFSSSECKKCTSLITPHMKGYWE